MLGPSPPSVDWEEPFGPSRPSSPSLGWRCPRPLGCFMCPPSVWPCGSKPMNTPRQPAGNGKPGAEPDRASLGRGGLEGSLAVCFVDRKAHVGAVVFGHHRGAALLQTLHELFEVELADLAALFAGLDEGVEDLAEVFVFGVARIVSPVGLRLGPQLSE